MQPAVDARGPGPVRLVRALRARWVTCGPLCPLGRRRYPVLRRPYRWNARGVSIPTDNGKAGSAAGAAGGCVGRTRLPWHPAAVLALRCGPATVQRARLAG